jgi:hypothetical protein
MAEGGPPYYGRLRDGEREREREREREGESQSLFFCLNVTPQKPLPAVFF